MSAASEFREGGSPKGFLSWRGKHFSFFTNRACEYFPCHETENPDEFNCLFCFCPLYGLGKACGGDFTCTEGGVKDCSACLCPHEPERYGEILARLQEASSPPQGD